MIIFNRIVSDFILELIPKFVDHIVDRKTDKKYYIFQDGIKALTIEQASLGENTILLRCGGRLNLNEEENGLRI